MLDGVVRESKNLKTLRLTGATKILGLSYREENPMFTLSEGSGQNKSGIEQYNLAIQKFLENKGSKLELSGMNLHAFLAFDRDLKTTSHFINLTELCLKNNNIGDKEIMLLPPENLSNVTTLDLSGNSIQDKGITIINNLTNLKTLNLKGNKVRENGAQILAQITSLKFLNLQENNLGASQVWDIFNSNTTLWGLAPVNWIDYNNPPKDFSIQSYKFSRLNLIARSRNNADSRKIAEEMENNNTIISLNLEGDYVSYGVGGEEYADMLEKNNTLQYLRLNLSIQGRKNYTTPQIEKALAANTTFKCLELGWQAYGIEFSPDQNEKLVRNARGDFWRDAYNCADILKVLKRFPSSKKL
jgi:Leucine-rich repeat (LRR) protein